MNLLLLLLSPILLLVTINESAVIENEIENTKEEITILQKDLRKIQLEKFTDQLKNINEHSASLKQPELIKTGTLVVECKGRGFLFIFENDKWISYEVFPYRTVKLPIGKYNMAFSNEFSNGTPINDPNAEYHSVEIVHNQFIQIKPDLPLNLKIPKQKVAYRASNSVTNIKSTNDYPNKYRWWN